MDINPVLTSFAQKYRLSLQNLIKNYGYLLDPADNLKYLPDLNTTTFEDDRQCLDYCLSVSTALNYVILSAVKLEHFASHLPSTDEINLLASISFDTVDPDDIDAFLKKYRFSFIEMSLQFLGYSQEPLERVKAEIVTTDELMTELNLEEILCQEKLKIA